MPRPRSSDEPVHLLVDSTGLKPRGPAEWLVEKHGTRTRRSWRKLHVGVDADTGEIMAVGLTANDDDDGAQVGPLLDQVTRPVLSFIGDGAFEWCAEQDGRDCADAARPASTVHCRARANGLAESVWLQLPCAG
jgi:Transposase DDE domain